MPAQLSFNIPAMLATVSVVQARDMYSLLSLGFFSDTRKLILIEHYASRKVDDAGSQGKANQRSNQTKLQGDPRSKRVKLMRETCPLLHLGNMNHHPN